MMLIDGGLAHGKPRSPGQDTFSGMVGSLVRLLRRLDAQIVGYGPEPTGVYVDWLPAGADPECPPTRTAIAREPIAPAPFFEDLAECEPDDELEILFDAPALAAIAAIAARAELEATGVVDLASRRR